MLGLALLGCLVATLFLSGVLGPARESQADPTQKVDIAYLYVTGEGATAKAWYDGVASAGIPVQDALDKFAKEGYEVARLTDNLRSQEDNVAFAILLQRKK
jgi:hypothetical protein